MTDQAPMPPRLLLKHPEAAKSLAISERTLWAETEPRGTLPCVRIGRAVRYDPDDLAIWIDGRKGGGGDD